MEKEKQLFIMGVTIGRELQIEYEENREELEKKYYTLLGWEAEKISNSYDEIKKKLPELFETN